MSSANLDSVLISKAVSSLLKFEEKKLSEKGKQSLVGYYSKPVLAQVQLKKPIKKAVLRPVRVKIPHSMFSVDEEDHTVCLFCRSDDKKAIEEYIEQNPIEGLTKVLSINDVRKLYNAFKDRKKLLGEHTHFICDSNIVSQLYNLLGKTFSDRNNYPVPVTYNKPDQIAAAMDKVVSSSYMHLKGHTITIRMGLCNMSAKQIAENVVQGLDFAVPKFTNGWKDVHSIHLKTSDSPALPIYSTVPNDALSFVKEKVKGKGKGDEEEVEVKGAAKNKGKGNVDAGKGTKAGAKDAAKVVKEETSKAGKTTQAKGKASAKAVPKVEEEEEPVKTETGKKRTRAASAPVSVPAESASKATSKGSRTRSGSNNSDTKNDDEEEVTAARAKPIKRIKSAVVKSKK